MKELLMTPGPTIVHPRILKALSKPMIHHRTQEFRDIMTECGAKLKKVFKTENDVLIIPGSGTASMDAAIANTITPGDKVLCLVSGKFSERFAEIAKTYGADVTQLDFDWNSSFDFEKIESALQEDFKLVTAVHNESSTGVRNEIARLGTLLKDKESLFIVDTISSLAGDDIRADEWGVDICIGGSQKALAMPAGLSVMALSEKAKNALVQAPNYYLNLKKYLKKFPETPYSTPVSLVYALQEALNIIEDEGLKNRIKRHAENAEYCRSRVKELGLKLFPASEEICSQTLTAISSEKANEIKKALVETYGIRVAGGQAHLKGKIFRIAHMGVINKPELDKTLDAIKEIIK